MKILFGLVLMLFALPVSAQSFSVKGGEHPDFTRIVIQGADVQGWEFGRESTDYVLRLQSDEPVAFDLRRAFDRIPKDRVSGIRADSDNSQLYLALSCACYATAFEFRPGVIVVDVKTGAPPLKSEFERELAPLPFVPSLAEINVDGVVLDHQALVEVATVQDSQPLPLETQSFSQTLLSQINDGVEQGLVEWAEDMRPVPEPASPFVVQPLGVKVNLSDLPGVETRGADGQVAPLLGGKHQCFPDQQLYLDDWLGGDGAAQRLGDVGAGIVAEFDLPNQEAILIAVRQYLSLGFGAEARQLLSLLSVDQLKDAQSLLAMTYLVDLDSAPNDVFASMYSCDGAASMWAVLAAVLAGDTQAGIWPEVNTGAVVRSFNALPSHLRKHLAPLLVEAFDRHQQSEVAHQLRNAAMRSGGSYEPKLVIMDALLQLSNGQAEKARDLAGQVLQDPRANELGASIALVEAAFATDKAVPMTMPLQILAFLQDHQGDTSEQALRRAYVLSAAMVGDYQSAFDYVSTVPDSYEDLWSLAVVSASDDLFLTEVTRTAERYADVGGFSPELSQKVAERLFALGFALEAKKWLLGAGDDPSDTFRILSARIDLALKDARAALVSLVPLASVEADLLRGQAALQLGDQQLAKAAFERAGRSDLATSALIASNDWGAIQSAGLQGWSDLAGAILSSDMSGVPLEDGPLAQGHAMLEQSGAARQAASLLLNMTSQGGTN